MLDSTLDRNVLCLVDLERFIMIRYLFVFFRYTRLVGILCSQFHPMCFCSYSG